MEALECIKTRRSIRKFTDAPVSEDTIKELVLAASYAPSWKNTQTARWNVVTDKALIKKISEEAVFGFEHNGGIMAGSQCLFVQSCVKGRCGYERDGSYTTTKNDSWEMFDAGIAAQTLCLAAHNMGLGTVIMGIIDDKKLEELLNIPETERVMSVIAVGTPADSPAMPPRKTVEEISRVF